MNRRIIVAIAILYGTLVVQAAVIGFIVEHMFASL